MATDYTDPTRDWTVNGRSLWRAIEVLGLFGDGASPAGAARVLLKEAGAVPADPAGHAVNDTGQHITRDELERSLDGRFIRVFDALDGTSDAEIADARTTAGDIWDYVMRDLRGQDAGDASSTRDSAGQQGTDGTSAGLPRPAGLERALRAVSDLHTAPDARRDSVTLGIAIHPYTLACEILRALREQDAGRDGREPEPLPDLQRTPDGIHVTVASLAAALDGFVTRVRQGPRRADHTGMITDPEGFARALMYELGKQEPGYGPRCTANSRSGGTEETRCTKDPGHVELGDQVHVNNLNERWTSAEANPTVTMPVSRDAAILRQSIENGARLQLDDGTGRPGDTTWTEEAEALCQVAEILAGLNGAAGERVIAHAAEMLGGEAQFE